MESSGAKSVRLPTFDGTAENFHLWWTHFLAFARVYRFSKAVDKAKMDADLPATESTPLPTDPDNKEIQEKVLARNAVAMANLTMAMTTESAMSVVFWTRTTDCEATPPCPSRPRAGAFHKRRQPRPPRCCPRRCGRWHTGSSWPRTPR